MSLQWQSRSSSLAWSNPLAWWWGLLTLVSGANIAVWFLLYQQLRAWPRVDDAPGIDRRDMLAQRGILDQNAARAERDEHVARAVPQKEIG